LKSTIIKDRTRDEKIGQCPVEVEIENIDPEQTGIAAASYVYATVLIGPLAVPPT
jgi:hypothetical protein